MINNAITTIGFALQSHVNNSYQEDTDENKLEREEIEEAWEIIKKHLRKDNEDECPLILQQEENKEETPKEKELRQANEEQTKRYGKRYGKIIDIQTYEV